MNTLLDNAVLFAQKGRLDSLSSGVRGRHARIDVEGLVIGVLVLAGIVLVVWVLSYLMTLQERRRSYTGPNRLFLGLCRAHRLRWSQCWLLWRVARAARLRDPARLFLDPERFDPAQLGGPLRARAGELQRLREILFSDLGDEPAA